MVADAPADWLVENLNLIPRGVEVLDVASGRGRNALFLARHGWRVHALDSDSQALAALSNTAMAEGVPITTEVIDLEAGTPVIQQGRYGAVLVFNYLHRPLMPVLVSAVAPGGVLVYETFTAGQAERGRPRNPAFLLHSGELPRLIQPLVILRAREGDFAGRLLSSIVAIRR